MRWKRFADKLSEKLMDVANLTVGALVVGQFLGGQAFQVILAIVGLVIWLLLYTTAYFVIQSHEGD